MSPRRYGWRIPCPTLLHTECACHRRSSADPAVVQLALCHVFFNVFGMFLWFCAPVARSLPTRAAALLGLYASHWACAPAVFLVFAFAVWPTALLGLTLRMHVGM